MPLGSFLSTLYCVCNWLYVRFDVCVVAMVTADRKNLKDAEVGLKQFYRLMWILNISFIYLSFLYLFSSLPSFMTMFFYM